MVLFDLLDDEFEIVLVYVCWKCFGLFWNSEFREVCWDKDMVVLCRVGFLY